MQFRSKSLFATLLLAMLLAPRDGRAARPAETLLPANTVGFLSFPSVNGLDQRFQQTHYGALLNDPRLAEPSGEFRKSTGDFRQEILDRLGLEWNPLVACTAGDLALAVVTPGKGKAALVLIADVTGHEPQAQALLTAAAEAGNQRHALRDGLLLAAESVDGMQTLLDGWDRKADEQLAQATPFRTVMKQSQSLLGTRAAQLRVYYVPLAWADATTKPKAAAADQDDDSKLDDATIMRRQGLAAVKGVGGLLSFPGSEFDAYAALAIYAPPPYEKAMLLLDFSAAAARDAPTWVPQDVGSYLTLSWNLKDFWRHYGSLYDDTSADGIKGAFNDMLDGLRDDPEGPQIDVRKDFFPKLSDQVTVISGPPRGNSERASTLYVIAATTDLTPLVKRYWDGDPDVRTQQWHGQTIWEIVAPQEEAGSDNPLNFISATAFVDKRLYLSTDLGLLKEVLSPHVENETLAAAPEFRDAQKRLDAIQPGAPFLRLFSWPEYAVRDTQRLLRLPTDASESKASVPVPEVPDAAAARHHLGAMSVRMDRIENGWTLTGFTLPSTQH